MKFVILAMTIALAGSAIHPFGPVKKANAPMDGPPMDSQSAAIISRVCANCHSERVAWPWYGYVAPVSWLLENDVSEARSHINLSRWSRYSQSEKEVLLSAIGAAVRTGEMPPSRYQMLHPEAKLSPAEREHLYQWARAEKRRMRSAISP
jgi:hypothetical protein